MPESRDAAGETQPWDPPSGFFDAYRTYEEASYAAMRRAMVGEVDEDFLTLFKSKADADILKIMRSLSTEARNHHVELYMMGYEAAKKHPRVQHFVRELIDTILQHHKKRTKLPSYKFDE